MAQEPPRADGPALLNATAPPPGRPEANPDPPYLSTADFARRVAVAVLITLVILAAAYFLWRGSEILLHAFAGVLLAVFLAALSEWVSRHTRLSCGWSLAVVVLGLLLLGAGFVYLFWTQLAAQMRELTPALNQSLEQIKAALEQHGWGKYLVENAPNAATRLAEGGQFTKVTGLVSGVAGLLETTVVVLIVGIFGAAEPGLYKAGLLRLVPLRNRPRVGQVVDAIGSDLRHWLVGQAVLMVTIGTFTAVGLGLIGVPMALTLGLIAGVLELVPFVGAWLSAVPAALVALLKGPEYVVYVLALYLSLHVLEGYVLLPLVQRRAIHLPPALTLVTQALLGQMFGVLGLFVAAPLAVAAMVLLKMLYVEDTLGDLGDDAPGTTGGDAKMDSQPA